MIPEYGLQILNVTLHFLGLYLIFIELCLIIYITDIYRKGVYISPRWFSLVCHVYKYRIQAGLHDMHPYNTPFQGCY